MEYAEGRKAFERIILSRIVAIAARELEFTENEWRNIFSSCPGSFSMSLQICPDPSSVPNPHTIADAIYYGDDPGPGAEELAKKIDMLPAIGRLALMDVIDRFWVMEHGDKSMSEILEDLGVPSAATVRATLDL